MDERRSVRRQQLLEAGLDLLAGGGTAAATVRAVCRKAELTQRYFYENFSDREELAVSVFEAIAEETRLAIIGATSACPQDPQSIARAAVEAVSAIVDDDPRKGRVLFVTSMTDESLHAKRQEAAPLVTTLIREQVSSRASADARDLTAVTLVGALSYLYFEFLTGDLDVSREAFTDHCVLMLVSGGTMRRG